MKRKSITTIMLTVLLSMVGAQVYASDIAAKNADGITIYYKWTNNNQELSVTYRGNSYKEYSNEYSGNVTIPEMVNFNGEVYSVTSIGDGAFYDCNNLTSVTIPNSVTSIGLEAFFNCSALTSITIPENVSDIGKFAFSGCTSLTSLTIPNSVTVIYSYAFQNCTGLTSVEIPSSVTEIGPYIFTHCVNLTSIVVANDNPIYDSRDNCNAIIETATNTMVVGCSATQIPNSVTEIAGYAFEGCKGLTSITIPNSVTEIGCFAYCTNLTSITIPNSVSRIGDNTFLLCESLTSITIPNRVKSIGSYAFWDCI